MMKDEPIAAAALKCARARTPHTLDAKYLALVETLDTLPTEIVKEWTNATISDATATGTVNAAARSLLMVREEMDRLTRRPDSPLSEFEAWQFRKDVMAGRHVSALCGEHRVTIREVETMRRLTDRLRFREATA